MHGKLHLQNVMNVVQFRSSKYTQTRAKKACFAHDWMTKVSRVSPNSPSFVGNSLKKLAIDASNFLQVSEAEISWFYGCPAVGVCWKPLLWSARASNRILEWCSHSSRQSCCYTKLRLRRIPSVFKVLAVGWRAKNQPCTLRTSCFAQWPVYLPLANTLASRPQSCQKKVCTKKIMVR